MIYDLKSMKKYPPHLIKLIDCLKTLPGVGNKSAERFAFHLLEQPEERLKNIASVIAATKERIRCCEECGCLIGDAACTLCDRNKRDPTLLSIVASPKDALTIEQTHEFRGLYHVLGGLLSPLEGRGPESLSLKKLFSRIESHSIQEIIIALDSTVEGDATSLYLTQEFNQLYPAIKISRLAFGIPIGSTLDYVDSGTLARALSGRSVVK